MRKAIGLLQIIFMIIFLSTIFTITIKYASLTTKQTVDTYNKEEAELFLSSAVEMTILAIQGYKRESGNCLKTVKIISPDQRFIADINISRYYLFYDICDDAYYINTPASNGTVMLDITVETNATHPKNAHPLRITKRTLQRI